MALISLTAASIYSYVAYGPVKVRRISGYNNQGANVFIQLHQKVPNSIATPIAAGDIPTYKSLQCFANDGFIFGYSEDGIYLTPLVIGMSSTEANFTAVGAGGGVDCTVEID